MYTMREQPPPSPMTESIPDDFEAWHPSGPFMAHMADIDTLYRNKAGNTLAVRVRQAHTNMHGKAHGGMLATLADCALGQCISMEMQSGVVTVHMSVDYLNPVQPGDWAEARVRIDKKGRRLIYATCLITVEEQVMLKVNAVFAVRAADRPGSDG